MQTIVHCCDNSEPFWEGFNKCFKKYCNDKMNVFWCSENKINPYFNNIRTGSGVWSDRLKKALMNIDDQFVFFMQEDMWPIEDPYKYINRLESYRRFFMYDCIHLSPVSKHYTLNKTGIDDLYSFDQSSMYLYNHQPGLWDRVKLLELLQHNEDPWQNEKRGTIRACEMGLRVALYDVNWYEHVRFKGELTQKGKELLCE